MGLAWEAILRDESSRDRRGFVDDIVSLLIDMGFPSTIRGWPSPPSPPPSGWTRSGDGRTWTCRWSAARGRASCGASPAEIPRNCPDPREIRERSIARSLNIPAGNVARRSTRVRTSFSSGEVYEIRPARRPAPQRSRLKPGRLVPEEARRRWSGPNRTRRSVPAGPEPERPAGNPRASTVRTVTLATCTGPGRTFHREADHREILRDDPRTSGPAWLGPGPGAIS